MGIHYLFQTQGQVFAAATTGVSDCASIGGPSAGTYDTAVALNSTFNAMILSHFLIPYLLMTFPELVLREGARICNIARPRLKNQAIDFDDFVCLKAVEEGTFRSFRDAGKYVFMMDLFTHVSWSDGYSLAYTYITYIVKKEFNIRFPHTHTTHLWPGRPYRVGRDSNGLASACADTICDSLA